MRSEVERLCEVGVLRKVNRLEWAAPTYIIKKKNGSARFISDFRELNKRDFTKTLSYPEDPRDATEPRRVRVRIIYRPKHGLLSYRA
jgi:hypothetical protein